MKQSIKDKASYAHFLPTQCLAISEFLKKKNSSKYLKYIIHSRFMIEYISLLIFRNLFSTYLTRRIFTKKEKE